MKKIGLLTIAVFICLTSCKSNYTRIGEDNANYMPYYSKIYKADSLYIVRQYKRSYEILDSLFKKYEPVQMRNYYEFSTYLKIKIILNKRIKIDEFSKLVSRYGFTDSALENDSLLSIYYLKENKHFEKKYKSLRDEFNSKLNLTLRNEIRQMNIDDQTYRKKGAYNQEKQEEIDSINSSKMKTIFSKYGYPNEYLIGNSLIDGKLVEIGVILLHTNNKERLEFYMPTILDYITKGYAPPIEYAYMKDQYLLYGNQKQYYGSYEMDFEKIGTSITELNRRRKSIGLPNYGYEDWRYKTLYPIDYAEQKEYFKKLNNNKSN